MRHLFKKDSIWIVLEILGITAPLFFFSSKNNNKQSVIQQAHHIKKQQQPSKSINQWPKPSLIQNNKPQKIQKPVPIIKMDIEVKPTINDEYLLELSTSVSVKQREPVSASQQEELAHIYAQLANIYLQKGDKTNYETNTKKALGIYERGLHFYLEECLTLKSNMATMLQKQGKYDQAIKLYRDVLSSQQYFFSIYDQRKIYVLNNIFVAEFKAKRERDARQTYQKCKQMMKQGNLSNQIVELVQNNYNHYSSLRFD